MVTTTLTPMPRCTAAAKTTRRGRSSSPRTSAQRWTVPRFCCKCCSGAKTKITLATQPSRSRSTEASRLPRATAKPSSTAKALGCKRLQAAATFCRLWQGTLQNSSGKLFAPSKVRTWKEHLRHPQTHLPRQKTLIIHGLLRKGIFMCFHVFSVLCKVPAPLATVAAPASHAWDRFARAPPRVCKSCSLAKSENRNCQNLQIICPKTRKLRLSISKFGRQCLASR